MLCTQIWMTPWIRDTYANSLISVQTHTVDVYVSPCSIGIKFMGIYRYLSSPWAMRELLFLMCWCAVLVFVERFSYGQNYSLMSCQSFSHYGWGEMSPQILQRNLLRDDRVTLILLACWCNHWKHYSPPATLLPATLINRVWSVYITIKSQVIGTF